MRGRVAASEQAPSDHARSSVEVCRSMNMFPVVLGLGVLVAALLILGSSALQQFLIYHPARERVAPLEAGLENVFEREIPTPDGLKVLAWWSPPEPGRPSVLYFHGNAGSLVDRTGRIRRFQERGIGVLMMTYRGYGGSMGKPTERDNVADGKRAYDALLAEGVPAEQIFIFGESLGTSVAMQVAAKKKAAGLILDAPYTSMLDLAHLHYPYLPADWFLRDRYETVQHIAKIDVPLLVVHGEADVVIPVAMGRAVFDAAPGPKTFLKFGGGHLDHDARGSFDEIIGWIERGGVMSGEGARAAGIPDTGTSAARS
jgi:fermentation-respiration switch protein FrsA (DUF1100 family)